MEIVNVSFGGGMSMQLTPVVVGLACPVTTIVEGNTLVITFTTNTPGAYPYTITGVSSSDIGNASLTGTFTANGETRTYTISDDLITEGRETFLMTLDNGQAGAAIGIDDSYYTLTANVASANEGNVFTVTLDTNGIHALPLGYIITGVSNVDLNGAPSLTGNFTANGQVLTYTANLDATTDGVEYFAISLNNGRANANVIINDTSTPYYILTANVSSANEGNVFTVTLDTNAIYALPLGYTITGVSSSDFVGSPSLTGNFTANGQVLTYTANADLSTLEGVEYFAISLNNGLANANVIINDTSFEYYTLTANRASVNEGNSFTVTLSTSMPLPLGYTITGVSSIDFIGNPSLTGNFTSNNQVLTFTANADVSTEGPEYFLLSLNNGQANANVLINDTSRLAAGQIEFTTPGTYTWVAPRITKVSVVAVGAGGGGVQGGGSGDGYRGGGGGGGGLVWVNNVSVTAGTTYSVTVGAGGPIDSPTINGGNSWFISNTYIVAAGGGAGQNAANPQAFAGYYINNSGFDGGGGNGGRGGLYAGNFSGSGGGGAGGYTGAGGQGATSGYGASTATAGSGGGGGGGGNFGGYAAGGGGGVGLWGEGANGAAGNNSGQGGFGGSSGLQGGDSSTGTGGRFGGGGGGGTQNSPGRVPIPGSRGGVRIMWSGGTVIYVERAYPSTNTANI
jgi:hypothetical protein